MKRRDFLFGASATLATVAASSPVLGQSLRLPVPNRSGLSILQGLTTQTATQLSVDVPRNSSVTYLLEDVATKKKFTPHRVRTVKHPSSSVRVDTPCFSNLELGHNYKFTVRNKINNTILDERFLKTVDLQKKNARIGLMSCMNDLMPAKNQTWPQAEAADLDYLFFLGDNVYGDLPLIHSPKFLWWRYVMSRQNIPYYRWKNLKPVLAIWDDHDFGLDNAGGNYRYKKHNLEIFKGFFAQLPEEGILEEGPGNSSFFQAFDHSFAFLDNRFYRGLRNGHGDVGFLGTEQLDWLNEKVSEAGHPTWLLQGSPVFGRGEKGSSYQANAPAEMETYFKSIRSWNVPVSFAAGDLHYSEISEVHKRFLGMAAHEVVSSCMHSKVKDRTYDNPNRHLAGTLKENFVILEKKSATGFHWKATCVAAGTKLLSDTVLTI